MNDNKLQGRWMDEYRKEMTGYVWESVRPLTASHDYGVGDKVLRAYKTSLRVAEITRVVRKNGETPRYCIDKSANQYDCQGYSVGKANGRLVQPMHPDMTIANAIDHYNLIREACHERLMDEQTQVLGEREEVKRRAIRMVLDFSSDLESVQTPLGYTYVLYLNKWRSRWGDESEYQAIMQETGSSLCSGGKAFTYTITLYYQRVQSNGDARSTARHRDITIYPSDFWSVEELMAGLMVEELGADWILESTGKS